MRQVFLLTPVRCRDVKLTQFRVACWSVMETSVPSEFIQDPKVWSWLNTLLHCVALICHIPSEWKKQCCQCASHVSQVMLQPVVLQEYQSRESQRPPRRSRVVLISTIYIFSSPPPLRHTPGGEGGGGEVNLESTNIFILLFLFKSEEKKKLALPRRN